MEEGKNLLNQFSELFEKWETSIATDEWEKSAEEIYKIFPQLCKNFLFGECTKLIGLLQTASQHGKEIIWGRIVAEINKSFVEMPKAEREILFPVYFKLGENAVESLLNLLKEVESKDLRIQIIEILKNIFTKSPTLLPKFLDTITEPWFLVRNLIMIAGEIGSEDIVPHMEKFMGNPNEKVKRELAETIIKIKGINAVPYLNKMLIDKNPLIRRQVVELLLRYQLWSTVGAENILFSMRNAMDRIGSEEEENFVRVSVSYVTNALPRLHNPERVIKGILTLVKMYGKKSLIHGRKSKTQTKVLSTLLNSLSGVAPEKLQPFLPELENSTNMKELQEVLEKLKSR